MKRGLLIGLFAYLYPLTLDLGLRTLAFGQGAYETAQPTLEKALNRSAFELLSGRTNRPGTKLAEVFFGWLLALEA